MELTQTCTCKFIISSLLLMCPFPKLVTRPDREYRQYGDSDGDAIFRHILLFVPLKKAPSSDEDENPRKRN